jgi:DNA-binding LacI/PurR family transcriptional regulator
MAAEYLLARGHRRCAFLGERQVSGALVSQCEQRLAGFRAACRDAGLDLPDDYVSLAPYSVEQAQQQARRLLDLPEPPTAIFAHSDMQALGVLKALRERSLSAPADVAVLGFDDIEVAAHIGLSTVRQPLVDAGSLAVELLLRRLAQPAQPVQRVLLPLEVVQREKA